MCQEKLAIGFRAGLVYCPAHSFETHAYARETGIMYGDNRADERAARRLRGIDCGHLRDTRACARAGSQKTDTTYGNDRAGGCTAREIGHPLKTAAGIWFSGRSLSLVAMLWQVLPPCFFCFCWEAV